MHRTSSSHASNLRVCRLCSPRTEASVLPRRSSCCAAASVCGTALGRSVNHCSGLLCRGTVVAVRRALLCACTQERPQDAHSHMHVRRHKREPHSLAHICLHAKRENLLCQLTSCVSDVQIQIQYRYTYIHLRTVPLVTSAVVCKKPRAVVPSQRVPVPEAGSTRRQPTYIHTYRGHTTYSTAFTLQTIQKFTRPLREQLKRWC